MKVGNIVVGVDFSPASERAAQTALRLARRRGARLHLMYAGTVPELPGNGPQTSFATAVEAMTAGEFKHAREQLEALRERLDKHGVDIVHAVIDGPAPDALSRAAREVHANLVVLGSQGRSGIERFFLGSVAERVCRIAPCPVLVVRNELPPGGANQVLVAVDFADHTESMLAALPMVLAEDAKPELFYSMASLDPGIYGAAWLIEGGVERLRQSIEADAARRAAPLLGKLRLAWKDARFAAEEGAPAHTIVQRAHACGAELIVLGSHSRSPVGQRLLGSVAERVLRHAACSVLVVRNG